VRRFIDANTHYGIELYKYTVTPRTEDGDVVVEKVVLNPLYKYACECCVDGFYQQYLWARDKGDKFLRLGIYNPRCRVPVETEIRRQLERGVIGFVLSPPHHGFSLLDGRLNFLYKAVEKERLLLFLHGAKREELEGLLSTWELKILLLYPSFTLDDKRVYYVVGSKEEASRFPRERSVYGSDSPYRGVELLESAKEFPYDEAVAHKNFERLLFL
jgi:predicted TIM-barrel fold metal-dependent hydrolase